MGNALTFALLAPIMFVLNYLSFVTFLTLFQAPGGFSSAGDFDPAGQGLGSAGPPEQVPMSRLQIIMAREIKGWPLYTIVIAAGQVCHPIYSESLVF